MSWSESAKDYQEYLRSALNVQRHALHVAELKPADVTTVHIENLTRDRDPLTRQLNRLEKGEFRIAVVGLEKAGKSIFVNAWLNCDLVPNANKRCTFTTTQIYSVTKDEEQRLEVIPRSQSEFDTYVEDLKQASQGRDETAKRAAEDLNTVMRHRNKLLDVIREGKKDIPFSRIEDILQDLWKYVADESVAHAIHEVRLYTTRLAESDGIVFFDVPGLNSGLGKHLEESKAMLEDCDAVILIQDSRRPSLEAHEQKLVDFVKGGDTEVSVADKLFVFAGQCDLQGSADSLERDQITLEEEWRKRAKLSRDRIVMGAQAVYLVLSGAANDNLRMRVGEPEVLRTKIATVKRLQSPTPEQELEATGIPVVKNKIKAYLQDDRIIILKKRCDQPIKRIISSANQMYSQLVRRYPENPDELRRQQENDHSIDFAQWWEKRWSQMEAAVNNYFQVNFDMRDSGENLQSVKRLQERYKSLIQEGLSSLPVMSEDTIRDIFDRNSMPVFSARDANEMLRRHLYENDIIDFLDDLASVLSEEILGDTQNLVDFMTSQMWDSSEVKRRIFDEDKLRIELESGLRTLFLRFARPVAEALIRAPLKSSRRADICRALERDIELLDTYYQGEELAFRVLKRYVKYGEILLTNPKVRKAVLGISGPAGLIASMGAAAQESVEPKEAETREEVVAEVKADLQALEMYLTTVVFGAAGIGAYLTQELKRCCHRFTRAASTWSAVALNEYKVQNPKLWAELPENLRNPEFNVTIAESLKQLRLALDDARDKGLVS